MLGPSFQMSYAAVAGLIAANQVWKDWRATHPAPQRGPLASLSHKILMSFVAIGATTLVATLATAPFSAYHFHRLNPYGIIGNSLGIPMVSLIVMPAAVIGTLLVPFGLDGVVWHVMGVGISGMLIVAQWVAGIENASVTAPNMEGPAFAMLVIAIIAFVALRSSLRWLALVPFGLWLVQLQAPHLPDLVIDPTGRMALARGEGGHYRVLAVGTPSRFTLSQWLPALGDGRAPSAASLREGVRCDKFGCVGRLADGRLVALSTSPDTLREDCRRADIVITPLRGIAACEGKRLLDRGHFDRYGATRIMTANAAEWRLDTSLDPAIKRPWRRPVAQHQNPAALTGASDPTSSADDASRNKRLQGHDAYQSDESRQKSGRAAKSLRIRPPHMPDSAGDDPALIPPLKAHYP